MTGHGRADIGEVVARKPAAASAHRRLRVAYLVTHPIQYQAPLLRLLSAEPDIDLTVFFQSDLSVNGYHDPGFGRTVRWDVPLLEGYRFEFLPSFSGRDRVDRLMPISYGIASRLWFGRFDALWVHGYARWFNWIAMAVAAVVGTRVLVRDEANAISAPRSSLKALIKGIVFRVLSRLCDVFLAIGTLNRRYYLANGVDPERIVVMPYCVDNTYFASLAGVAAVRREEFRTELGLSAARPIILYASKLMANKRAGDLLAAYKRLIAEHPERPKPYLLFVGDGPQKLELQASAREDADVKFMGFVNQSELPSLFDLCDVFVLPSEQEPWGLVVNEAMSVGRAVIVSDQVGCGPDLVRSGVNGYVFPVGEIKALTHALADVLESPERISSLGRASAEIIASWTFREDIAALRAGLAISDRRRRQKTGGLS